MQALSTDAVTYSLWETDSANILATLDNEGSALALVRDLADSMGSAYIDSLSLTATAEDGSVDGIAAGAELLALALHRQPRSA